MLVCRCQRYNEYAVSILDQIYLKFLPSTSSEVTTGRSRLELFPLSFWSLRFQKSVAVSDNVKGSAISSTLYGSIFNSLKV